tara:strand:- start:538 stop:690 length:153 start_codon:yes stop_codon:yes gene_type:complete
MIIDGTFEAFIIGETFHYIKMGKNVIQVQLEFLGAIIIRKNYIEKIPAVL